MVPQRETKSGKKAVEPRGGWTWWQGLRWVWEEMEADERATKRLVIGDTLERPERRHVCS